MPGARPQGAALAASRAAGAAVATSVEAPPDLSNGHVELRRDLALKLPRTALERARRISLDLRLEDEHRNVVGGLQQGYDLERHPEVRELLLRLLVSVTPRD